MLNRIHKPKSYICHGRPTPGQRRAYAEVLTQLRLPSENGLLDLEAVFGRVAPCFVEIGFGSGSSLLALAQSQPQHDFIGIETHRPGLGALALGVEKLGLTNLRAFQGDAVEILEACFANSSLAGVQLFFPDPWPKRRHHPRRIIQSAFVELVTAKLKSQGSLHVATDWQDYATHMLDVLTREQMLQNIAGAGQFSGRSSGRPITTKFERRALEEGRQIRDLQFIKI